MVGPYSTWAECNYQFQYTLNMRIQDWGWIATEINPCSYQPPYGSVQIKHELALAVDTSTSHDNLEHINRILDDVRAVREEFRADEYDAALERIR